MKKVIIIAIASCVASACFAQKGSWYAGGNVGFNSTTNKVDNNGTETNGTKTTGWSFSPEVGTFFTNHVQFGVGLTLAGSKVDARTAIVNESKRVQTGATLYSRYFIGEGNFRPFVGINAFLLPGNEKNTVGTFTTTTKLMNYGANLNAGFGYGLNSRVTVVGSFGTLGFNETISEVKGSNTKVKTNSFGLDANSLGNRFNIGVYYTFLR